MLRVQFGPADAEEQNFKRVQQFNPLEQPDFSLGAAVSIHSQTNCNFRTRASAIFYQKYINDDRQEIQGQDEIYLEHL